MRVSKAGRSGTGRRGAVAGTLLSVFLLGACTDLHSTGDVAQRAASLAASDEVTIGVVWPDDNQFGHAPEGVELAVEEVNEAIARLPRPEGKEPLPPVYKRFRMRFSTYGYSQSKSHGNTYKVATALTDDKTLLAVVGYPHLEEAKQAAVVYSRYGVLFLDPTVTSAALSRVHLPFVFRLMYGEREEARAIGDLLERLGYAHVALLTERQNDSVTTSNHILEVLDRRASGAIAVGLSRYFAENDNYYRSVVPELMKKSFDAIILSGSPHATTRLVTALRTMEVDTPLIGTNELDVPSFVADTGKAAEGMIITSARDDRFEATHRGKDFSRRFEERFGHPPDTTAILAYEAVMFVRQAIVQIGSVDPEMLDAALRYMPKFTGVTGQPYTFTPKGDIKGKIVTLRQVKEGALVPYRFPETAPRPAEEKANTMENDR